MRNVIITQVQCTGPPRPKRDVVERLIVHFPRAYGRLAALVFPRLSPRSRLRRTLLRRTMISAFAAFHRQDFELLFDSGTFAPDAEFIPDYAPGLRSVYRGREGFVDFMRTWSEDFDDWSIRPERIIDVDDDRVVVLVHQRATGKGSGAQVDLHMAFLYQLEEGRVIRMQTFIDPAEAFKAVGLTG
jgi:ketosteroid isomerase-like protein